MSDQQTCDYHDDHDEQDQPRGNRCGQPATQIIFWKDRRYSLGCDQHIVEISQTVPELVRSFGPVNPDPLPMPPVETKPK